MTPTTFRALREHLGLPVAYAAGALGVNRRTLSRWESGDTELPTYAQAWLQAWVDHSEALVSSSTLMAQIGGTLCLHASEAQYRAAHRSADLDHQWWNRSAARVAAATGAELAYEACRPDKPARVALLGCESGVE